MNNIWFIEFMKIFSYIFALKIYINQIFIGMALGCLFEVILFSSNTGKNY